MAQSLNEFLVAYPSARVKYVLALCGYSAACGIFLLMHIYADQAERAKFSSRSALRKSAAKCNHRNLPARLSIHWPDPLSRRSIGTVMREKLGALIAAKVQGQTAGPVETSKANGVW